MSQHVDNFEPETAVYRRYAAAAHRSEQALCCPIDFPTEMLSVIPDEIIERDYGCGDPTPYVNTSDTVLDLGSGSGKLCYILSQVVGERGRVIGVDCNREMLSLARRHQSQVAERLGFQNVQFRYGLIQDLRLDLELLNQEVQPFSSDLSIDWLEIRILEERLRRERPLIADDSVDCVVSNCVLNLVRPQDRHQLFAEIYRVLKPGGRAAISDITSDEDLSDNLRDDPNLWSGCISGAFREDKFLAAFEAAGFHGVEIVKRQHHPWRTIEGVEFRSMTVVAFKGKQGPCLEANQAVIYRGPFKQVEDDDGHVYLRGTRTAVCDKTFRLLQRPPYSGHFIPVDPREIVNLADAKPFDCRRPSLRPPRETKGLEYQKTTTGIEIGCGEGGPCC